MKRYNVLTKSSVLDIDTCNETALANLYEEQSSLIPDGFYIIHVLEDEHFCSERYFVTTSPIDISGETLAVKEGCDVVRWENGLPGFVGYYNLLETGIEVLPIPEYTYKNLLDSSEEYIKAAFDDLGFAYCYK